MIDKKLITRNFGGASLTYDDVARVQRNCAQHLVTCLSTKLTGFKPQSILDVGTGTGYVIELLLNHFPTAQYLLNDISPQMIEAARNKFPNRTNLEFIVGDIETVNLCTHDLIISSLSLHWLDHIISTIRHLYSKSEVMALSFLVKGTFADWKQRLADFGLDNIIRDYPDEAILNNAIAKLNARQKHSEVLEFNIDFCNSINLMAYLKNLGVQTANRSAEISQLRRLVRLDSRACRLNYRVMFVILQK